MSLLEKYPNFFDQIYNIYLVSKGARTATLLDPYKDGDPDKQAGEFLVKIAIRHGLVGIKGPLGFYLVSKPENMVKYMREEKYQDSDILMGKFLGFNCAEHDYFDTTKPRYQLEIYAGENQVYAELCEQSRINRQKLEEIGRNLVLRFSEAMSPSVNRKYPLRYVINMF